MNYTGFYIKQELGNNEFSYDKRINKKIYVPRLFNIGYENIIDELKLSNKIAFSEIDENKTEINTFGLEKFLHIKKCDRDIYIFDNHNHAFYFIASNFLKKRDFDKTMLHFDQHKDMRIPKLSLKEFTQELINGNLKINYDFELENIRKNLRHITDIENIFDDINIDIYEDILFLYTNYHLNVGNFIVPLIENKFIKYVDIIDSSYSLDNIDKKIYNYSNICLDIDLDFFSKDMDYIKEDKKIQIISKCYEKADIITICTSPYFIEFERAKKYLSLILNNF